MEMLVMISCAVCFENILIILPIQEPCSTPCLLKYHCQNFCHIHKILKSRFVFEVDVTQWKQRMLRTENKVCQHISTVGKRFGYDAETSVHYSSNGVMSSVG